MVVGHEGSQHFPSHIDHSHTSIPIEFWCPNELCAMFLIFASLNYVLHFGSPHCHLMFPSNSSGDNNYISR